MHENKNKPEEYEGRRFATVVADPPWDVYQSGHYGACEHYGLLSVADIKALPVGQLALPDAHCWLWVTNATLRVGFSVLESWGFVPRSTLTWVKPRIGLGHYLRNATEHLLFATRGDAPVLYKSQPTWMFAPLQEHSHKPEEYFAVVERVSPGPYLELFARRRPPVSKGWMPPQASWSVWGEEVDSDIVVPGYPVPSDARHHGEPAGSVEGGE